MQSRITFDTQLKIALTEMRVKVARFLRNESFVFPLSLQCVSGMKSSLWVVKGKPLPV